MPAVEAEHKEGTVRLEGEALRCGTCEAATTTLRSVAMHESHILYPRMIQSVSSTRRTADVTHRVSTSVVWTKKHKWSRERVGALRSSGGKKISRFASDRPRNSLTASTSRYD